MTRLPVGPEKLLQYFEGVNREYPAAHWQNGATMCRRWQTLIEAGATQADVDWFLSRLDAEPSPGTGWVDLGLQFRHWARSQGFRDEPLLPRVGDSEYVEQVRRHIAWWDRYRRTFVVLYVFLSATVIALVFAVLKIIMGVGNLPGVGWGFAGGLTIGTVLGMAEVSIVHGLVGVLTWGSRSDRLLVRYHDSLRQLTVEDENRREKRSESA